MSLQGFDPTGRASGTGIITSSTPDPKGARVPLAGGLAKQSQFTVSSQKQLIEQYRKMSQAEQCRQRKQALRVYVDSLVFEDEDCSEKRQ